MKTSHFFKYFLTAISGASISLGAQSATTTMDVNGLNPSFTQLMPLDGSFSDQLRFTLDQSQSFTPSVTGIGSFSGFSVSLVSYSNPGYSAGLTTLLSNAASGSTWSGSQTTGNMYYQLNITGNANAGSLYVASLSGVTAPVPEPETYAMLLAGLGLVGAVSRRRKTKLAKA